MKGQLKYIESDQTLIVEWTRRGRFLAAFYRAIKVFPIAMGALAIFFLPDYLGRFRGEEPFPGLFWLSLAMLAVLGSALVALFRFMRRDRWIFDGTERKVVAEVKTLYGRPSTGEAELREVEALLLDSRGGLRRSALMLRLDSGEEEELFSGNGLGDDLEEVAERVMGFMREQRYQVELQRVDGQRKIE